MLDPLGHERFIAELAAQRATILTRKVLSFVDKGELSKTDDTPVSIADFGAQALIVSAIRTSFPDDKGHWRRKCGNAPKKSHVKGEGVGASFIHSSRG